MTGELSVEDRIIHIVEDFCSRNDFEVTNSTRIKDVIRDSLDMIDMSMDLEDEFNITIEDWMIPQLDTCEELVILVTSLLEMQK